MLRLLNYLLFLVTLLAFLIIIVPFGLSAREFSLLGNPVNLQHLKDLVGPYWNPAANMSSTIIFLIAACALLPVQQIFWLKRQQKDNHYPVDPKFFEKYKVTMYLTIIMIVTSFAWFMGVWLSSPSGYPTSDVGKLTDMYMLKRNVYIGGIVVVGLLGLSIMGYASYVNLMITYEQQKQMVDEGIANGTYDPVTRRPIDEVKAVDETIKEIKEAKQDDEIDPSSYSGSSGLVPDAN